MRSTEPTGCGDAILIRRICTYLLHASLLLVSVASPPARAADWRLLILVNGRAISLDIDSIGREGALTSAWLRFDFPDEETESILKFTRRSAKALWYFDCPTRSATVVRNVSYSLPDLSGAVVHDSGMSASFVFFPLTKGTYAEAAGTLVCAGIPVNQPSAIG